MPTFPIDLDLPNPGDAQWSSKVNTAFDTVEAAVNASVTTDRIDIQSSLDLQGHDAINVKAIKVVTNTDDGSSRQLFTKSDGEWYCRDGSGRLIRLTNSGTLNIAGVSGGIGGAYNGNASYNSSDGKFVLNTLTPGEYAVMENGSINLHLGSGASYTVLRTSPVIASTYTLTFPSAVPVATKFVTIDSTGTLASGGAVADVTASNASFTTRLEVPGMVVFSGSVYRTQWTQNLHWGAGRAAAGSPTYASNGWIFGANTAIDLPLPFEAGSRLVSVTVQYNRTVNFTASIYEDDGAAASNVVAQRYVGTGSVNTFFMGPGDVTSGSLPFRTATTSSLRLKVQGNASDVVFGRVSVIWDKPIGG